MTLIILSPKTIITIRLYVREQLCTPFLGGGKLKSSVSAVCWRGLHSVKSLKYDEGASFFPLSHGSFFSAGGENLEMHAVPFISGTF